MIDAVGGIVLSDSGSTTLPAGKTQSIGIDEPSAYVYCRFRRSGTAAGW
jgi:hypothetical protein